MDVSKGLITLTEQDLAGKVALVRVDLNVPMQGGAVSDDTRLRHAVPTIRAVLAGGGRPVLLTHFGRPKGRDMAFSTAQLVAPLQDLLGAPVIHCPDCIGDIAARAIADLPNGSVLLLENTRFHDGETTNDAGLSAELARLGDVFIADAFSVAHRAHASSEGIAHHLPACAGLGMAAEVTALTRVLQNPKRPVLAVVGGAKVSTKLTLLENLLDKMDYLCIGGGMANTFLGAQGVQVGRSLCEPALFDAARAVMDKAAATGCQIILPCDIVVANELREGADSQTLGVNDCPSDAMILDAGAQTVARICAAVDKAKTVLWNGPLGAFETPPFDAATNAVARAVAQRTKTGRVTSVGGGGDTVAALNTANVASDFSYLSTAGGAFLEWLEGKSLPGVAILLKGAKK